MGLIFLIEVAELGFELRAKSREAASPALAATDDGRIDEELLPTGGDSESGRAGIRIRLFRRRGRGRKGREDVILGWNPQRRMFLGRAGFIDLR